MTVIEYVELPSPNNTVVVGALSFGAQCVMMLGQVETSFLSSNMTAKRPLSQGSIEIPHVHAKLKSWSVTIFIALSSVRSFAIGGQGSLG